MSPDRLLDKSHPPSEEDIAAIIGQPAAQFWSELRRFVCETYILSPEWKYEGIKSGWSLYMRKGGRSLLTLSPKSSGLSALVVLGAKESEKALAEASSFGPNVRERLQTAPVFHDGRWLFISVNSSRDVEDIQRLLLIKKNPPRKKIA